MAKATVCTSKVKYSGEAISNSGLNKYKKNCFSLTLFLLSANRLYIVFSYKDATYWNIWKKYHMCFSKFGYCIICKYDLQLGIE